MYSDNDNEFKRVMLITAGGLGFFFAFTLFFKPLHQRNKAKGNLKKPQYRQIIYKRHNLADAKELSHGDMFL